MLPKVFDVFGRVFANLNSLLGVINMGICEFFRRII